MKIYTYEGKANISGDRIHQARTAQRLSQDALAAKLQVAGLGIGREAISRIETGLRFVTDYELVIFARVLGVTLNGSPQICRIEKGLHKNVLAFIFFCPPPRRAGQHRPGSPVPALPLLFLSCAASGSPVPAAKPAPWSSFLPNFIFLTPLYFFRPAQGEVKKRPHTYPTFALSNPQG